MCKGMSRGRELILAVWVTCAITSLCTLLFMTGQLTNVCKVPLDRDLRVIEGALPLHQDDKVYRERRDNLVTACSNPNISNTRGSDHEIVVRDHFFVDHKHKLIFCGIEKVGCTFWKRVLQISTGIRPEKNPYDIPGSMAHSLSLQTFRGMGFDEILDIVSSYTKFLFVRNPYSRLFSCYIDKLFSPNYAYFVMRQKIFNMAEKTRSHDNSSCAPFITFRQFVKFVIYALKTGDGRDGHFVPMYDHCRPCQLRYDIIGKMEHFSEDAAYVIQGTGISDVVEVNSSHNAVDADIIVDTVTNLKYSSQKIKTCMPLSMAVKYVWRKCQINGIIDKNFEMPEKFGHDANFDGEGLANALLSANKMSNGERTRGNRHEALLEAFRSVSREDLREFRRIFQPDFDIFSYDNELEDLYTNNETQPDFSYLEPVVRRKPGRARGKPTTIRRLLADVLTYGGRGRQQELDMNSQDRSSARRHPIGKITQLIMNKGGLVTFEL